MTGAGTAEPWKIRQDEGQVWRLPPSDARVLRAPFCEEALRALRAQLADAGAASLIWR